MASNTKKTKESKRKTPLRVILVRALAIALALMMIVTIAYYLFPVFMIV